MKVNQTSIPDLQIKKKDSFYNKSLRAYLSILLLLERERERERENLKYTNTPQNLGQLQ
jgi:hypothetical protein